MRDFNGNAEKSNAARTAYDLELELIDRDLEFDLGEAIRACGTEAQLRWRRIADPPRRSRVRLAQALRPSHPPAGGGAVMNAPSAADIAEALNGRPSGSGYVCECPAHVDLRPSLSVTSRDGRVLVHCHAGCPQSAVIGALRREGLWGDAIVLGSKRDKSIADTTDTADAPTPPSLGAKRDPMRSWRSAMPFSRGCVADLYLNSRGSSSPTARRAPCGPRRACGTGRPGRGGQRCWRG